MQQYLRRLEDVRRQFLELMALYNAGQIEPFLAEHLDDVAFVTPAGLGAQTRGNGKIALRNDIARYRGERGRLSVVDVFPLGDRVSLLVDDETGHRTVFCLNTPDNRLIQSVFAFDVLPCLRRALCPRNSLKGTGRPAMCRLQLGFGGRSR
jgi:hypothetical protein